MFPNIFMFEFCTLSLLGKFKYSSLIVCWLKEVQHILFRFLLVCSQLWLIVVSSDSCYLICRYYLNFVSKYFQIFEFCTLSLRGKLKYSRQRYLCWLKEVQLMLFRFLLVFSQLWLIVVSSDSCYLICQYFLNFVSIYFGNGIPNLVM